MSETRDMLIGSLDRVVGDILDTPMRTAADRCEGWPGALWSALEAQGMTAIGETADADLGFGDIMAVVARAGYHAAPVPLAETVLARRLLGRARIDIPDGALSVAPPGAGKGVAMSGGKPVGTAAGVPWGGSVGAIVVAAGPSEIALVDAREARIGSTYNMAGEPRDVIDLARAKVMATAGLVDAPALVEGEGALVRAAQMAGALSRVLEHTLTWASDRVQFGKPIAKFQAVQHLLAELAAEVAAAGAAVELGVEACADRTDRLAIGIAKARAGEAAGRACAIAHEVFGAMGFTQEHALHYATRRLWSWRDEFGPEIAWQTEIGRIMAAKGADGLWPALTALG